MVTRTAADHVIEVLGRVPLFQGLPRSDLERIAKLVHEREIGAGEFLFREGDPGDKFYLVEDGAVEILRERPLGDHERLAVKRGGDAIGELSLLHESPRSTSVRAVEDTRLLSLTRGDFDELLGGESLSVRVLRGMARTLRSLDVRFARYQGGGLDALHRFGRLVLHGLEPAAAPDSPGYTLAGATAREDSVSGGSLWDALSPGDGRSLLAVMDVKGTGLPPAYLLAITRALLHELGPEQPFEKLLARLNTAVFRNLFEGLDECVEAGLLHIDDDGVRWSCAGDQPAVVLRADGTDEQAAHHGPPLGILPHFEYGTSALQLDPGDLLLIMSDAPAGLVRGAIDLIRARPGAEPAEMARLLRTALRKVHSRGAGSDVAFVLVRRD